MALSQGMGYVVFVGDRGVRRMAAGLAQVLDDLESALSAGWRRHIRPRLIPDPRVTLSR